MLFTLFVARNFSLKPSLTVQARCHCSNAKIGLDFVITAILHGIDHSKIQH